MRFFDRFKKIKKEDALPPAKTVGTLPLAPTPRAHPVTQKEKKVPTSSSYHDAYRMLRRPHVTEKATHLQHQHQIIFEVSLFANKIEIKKAIQAVYGVIPKKITMITLPRKTVWFGRTQGQTNLRKKAIAVFAKDQKLDLFSGV